VISKTANCASVTPDCSKLATSADVPAYPTAPRVFIALAAIYHRIRPKNDGGALGYLPEAFRFRIKARFNDDADLEPFEPDTIDRWEVLSGDIADPDVREVPMDRPFVVASGNC
jgi:hypothetical protein